ncbi:MAG: efflux RND transporter periplasmic adaptor subunit [Candidatus Melainabacteria bacterium]
MSAPYRANVSLKPWVIFILVTIVVVLLVWWLSRMLMGGPGGGPNPMGQGVPVTMDEVTAGSVDQSVDFLGEVTSDLAADIHPQVAGRIQKVLVIDGQAVQAGQPLFQLDASQQAALAESLTSATRISGEDITITRERIKSLEAQREAVAANLDFQQKQTERYRTLAKTQTVSTKDLEQAETALTDAQKKLTSVDASIAEQKATINRVQATISRDTGAARSARANLDFYTVKAPFAGVVGDIMAHEGDVVDPQQTLTRLTNRSEAELTVAVPSAVAERVRRGTPLMVKNAAGDSLVQTTVSAVMPSVDPGTQTVVLKARLNNLPAAMMVDERLKVSILWGSEQAVLIPASAVFRMAGQPFVYVANHNPPKPQAKPGDGYEEKDAKSKNPLPKMSADAWFAHMRPVTLGGMSGDNYVVTDGVQAGETLVTGGIQKLRGDGLPVMPLPPEKAAGGPPAPPETDHH